MPTNDKNTLQKNVSQILRISGIDTPSQIPVVNNTTEFSTFSQKEMRNLMSNRANTSLQNNEGFDAMMSTLVQSANDNENWSREIDELKVLTPEIEDAADIVVSSIFSPTDMQTNQITVMTADTNLGVEAEEKINQVLTDFFNDKDKLPKKAEKWTRDARYGSGATGIVLLPMSNIRNLNALSDVKDRNLYSPNTLEDTKSMVSGESLKSSFERFQNSIESSSENWVTSQEAFTYIDEELHKSLDEALVSSLEAINTERKSKDLGELKSFDVVHGDDLVKAVKNLFIDNKTVRFYSDVKIFEKSMNHSNTTINKITKDVFSRCFGDNNIRMYTVDPEFDMSQKDNVVVVEFASSSIIPITVPNEPSKHLAYIALTDQFGNPLSRGFVDDYYKNGSRTLNDANSRAVVSRNFSNQFTSEMTDKQRFDVSSQLFTTAMKVMIKTKMQEYGLGNIDINAHNALGSCLFNYLLKDNKINMVFIPAAFVVYTAFDYHKNGTGKSLIEDISTIVALRNTLTMAGIMAAAENSVNNRTIEVNVDEKNANPLQTLETIRNMYIDKKVVKLNHNPMDIQRGLYNKALTLLPKNLRGIREGLQTQVEHRSTGAVQPDENLREMLTKWMIQKLRVPNSTMNDVGQNEFSRSVAITNLHFNNQLHSLQDTTAEFLSRYVRIYTSFSYELQEELRTIIKNIKRTDKEFNKQPNAIDGKFDENIEFNDATTVDKYISLIISNMYVSLPKPRAVVDKAQYTEIAEYIGTIEKVIEDIYPNDLMAEDAYRKAFGMVKAKIKSDYVRQFIQEIGFNSNYELPNINEVEVTKLQDMLTTMINHQRMINATTKLFGEPLNSADADGSNLRQKKGSDDNDDYGGGDYGGGDEGGGDEFNYDEGGGGEPEAGAPEEGGGGENELDENGNLPGETEEGGEPTETNENELDENGNLPGETEEEIPEAQPSGPIETGGAEEPEENEESEEPKKKGPEDLEFPDDNAATPPNF